MLESIFASIFVAANNSVGITWQSVIISISIACALGVFISYFYMITFKTLPYSQGFLLTLVMLPTIIALIIMLIGNNIAGAFSLAGVFSIVRFRARLADPKDIAYIFFSVAVGLALGMGYVGFAALFAIVLCGFMFFLCKTNFGSRKNMSKTLRILMPEDLDYESVFDDIFSKYTESSHVKRTKTADLGSLYELTYEVYLKEGMSEKGFIDELRCRNGNLTISMTLTAEQEGKLR